MSDGQATVLQAPVKVVCVDVDEHLPALTWEGGEASYRSALVFFQRGAQVVGHAQVAAADARREIRRLAEPLRSDTGPSEPPRLLPRVSVVVPSTLDRLEPLERALRSLMAQTHADFEVIVVDNRPATGGDRAALHRRLRIDSRITVVDEAMPGISAARNRGIAAATSDIVAFTDDDVEVSQHWLDSIATAFERRPDIDCVTGLVLPAELETQPQIWFEVSGGKIDQRYDELTYQIDKSTSRFLVQTRDRDGAIVAEPTHLYRAKFGMGANMAFRKPALEAMGGFDLALGAGTPSRGGEDIVMISRLLYDGRAVAFDPAVVVHHYHRRDLDALRTQMRGYGVGYTAALAALVRHSPQHLLGILTMVGAASRVAKGRSDRRVADDFPASLSRTEMAGLAAGPFAYLKSAWKHRSAAARRAGVARLAPSPVPRQRTRDWNNPS